MRLLFLSLSFLLITPFSAPLFAHAGVDHGDNCIVKVGGVTLKLGGFQSRDKMNIGKHFCRLFPATGEVIFSIENHQHHAISQRIIKVKMVAITSVWDLIFDYDNAFKQVLAKAESSDEMLEISQTLPDIGFYALEVSLQTAALESSLNLKQHFVFFIGIPIIKILVLLSFILLIVMFSVLMWRKLFQQSDEATDEK